MRNVQVIINSISFPKTLEELLWYIDEHARFIDMLSYKAKEYGITVITVDERYTSGTSAIDDELPVKANYDYSRRVHRGMFRSNVGIGINADLNAAYQMIKK